MDEKKQREEALRAQIVSVSLKAFMEQGLRAVTMDEVAALLGISKRTLYELFPDKESLVLACVMLGHQQKAAEVRKMASKHKNVISIILAFYKYTVEEYYHMNPLFMLDARRYPAVQKQLEEIHKHTNDDAVTFFERGVKEGLFRNDVNFRIAQELLHHQFSLLMEGDLGKRYMFLEVYEAIFLTFLRGVSTEKGVKIIDDFVKEYRKNKK